MLTKLLSLAVPTEQQDEARAWLRLLLRCSQVDPWIEHPKPTVHNEPLEAIESSAKALLAGMQNLREQPHAFMGFWSGNPTFEADLNPPATELERFESKFVIHTIETIAASAEAAKDRRRHRPRDRRKEQIVNMAAGFFEKFSPLPLSGALTSPFAEFARAFYAEATGVEGENIDSQIRRVGKERARTEVPQK
jgi:hypothetical protein